MKVVAYIAAYIRVSTEEQAERGNSLSEQEERLKAYCKAMGWPKPKLYIDDGYSAKDLRRPAVQKLINDVQSNKISIVLTSKLDRLSRNLLDLLQTVDLFSEHDCNYVSASEGFDTSTAVGRMTLQLLGTFAEFERERNSERVKDNMLSLAKNTNKAITQPCFGYDIIDRYYSINEEEAHFVRMMFDLAEEGNGHRKIAKILNDNGSVTKKGKMWDQINVKRLIQNETICGMMIYNKRETKNGKVVIRDKSEWVINEEHHQPIIPKERFDRVQEIMKSRSRAYKHADSETYLLTGLVVCKHCGRNMKGSTARHKSGNKHYTYYRYICASYVLGYDCKHHAIHRDQIETAIINRIKNVSKLSVGQLDLTVSPSRNVQEEIKDLQNQLTKVNRKMQRQIEAYENELISGEDLKAARLRVEKEREELNEKISRLASKKNVIVSVKANVERLMHEVTSVDRLVAKAAIRQLIDKIFIEDGKEVTIAWKV